MHRNNLNCTICVLLIIWKSMLPLVSPNTKSSMSTIITYAATLCVTTGADCCACFVSCFAFQSFTAALMASSASILQCNFTGGNFKCAAISEFLIFNTSSTLFPFTHSVATELLAIADPQPNVLNFDSKIVPSSATLICNFITSPQAGAPTSP